ncbi:UDP-N-acetylmuramoyl-tripeptide--D-alanyl-D-alanine ligase [Nitrosomonas eutropha]|uniref:UDP-N-acetylmuramoyl-tripeptide--D-alanyl-D-alanine ligase n=3 Tax=Nitrosomonas TaxID=914 RepID=A0ABX5MB79_9PROT|nr:MULTISPECIES: UDP-N-acetylmuramoyl-tripeptide--D-alanyl-D-alanine ligase [Nitrosomonas]ABI58534.1 UDP-N-acetylmuramoyl-tripeptide--D-alanyl-D-alanine ligase [Nitrosomonas eutropha C91]MXS80973.1 UDP-N-acetylmuramoyl-tripeptide--D-alanyl-D-alanine ligase [Nitrosomonas sp. GH22]PXV82329.1 UDP-N-acetylmuramoyl-tripeptide--D-alanyl-D-alanine ligase [Nitrosomonas eutropha]SCX13516.1 UDP-N-acetylmuramoyl-tripeptide--D-alanyl-D-alanine ligase [Nitrosomonas eutropha]SDW14481.1 UDP-N-acetylmuramoyl-
MMSVQEAALALHANSNWSGGNPIFTGVSTDSRTLRPGDLFIALSGEQFDGQHFISTAIEKGAVAAMVSTDTVIVPTKSDFGWIKVNDTRLGFGQLAANWRQHFTLPLVAVTGSNGKTTVKEMIAAIFRHEFGSGNVLATTGNLNNDIGVPQMLLQLNTGHTCAVIEMGMNHAGEIAYLSQLAAPTIAVITNAGTAHIEHLGTTEAIARAKGEIFTGLGAQGIAIINADDAYAQLWRQLAGSRQILDFGITNPAAIRAQQMSSSSEAAWLLQLPDDKVEITLQVPGRHNIYNALAAAAAATAAGISTTSIAEGLHNFMGTPGRLQKKVGLYQSILIDDTYNANPDSMQAALNVLAEMPGKKILIMGDMGELGTDAAGFHYTIGQQAAKAGIDALLALGELSQQTVAGFGSGAQYFADLDTLLEKAKDCLGKNVSVLVKGSRFMRMERVIEQLQDRYVE